MTRSNATFVLAALAVAGVAGLAAACKSSTGNDCGNGTSAPSLVGTYSLLSYTIGTNTITAPAATGELRFHTSTYGVDLTIPNGLGGNQNISDSGSYNIVGASCIQEMSVESQPQFSGSFNYVASDSTLHVSGTAGGQVAASLWKKTS